MSWTVAEGSGGSCDPAASLPASRLRIAPDTIARMHVTVLAGGVGAARFLEGLVQVVPPEEITVISNIGDDDEFFGLHVSPDIDTVIYTLAGVIDPEHGWGLAGETYSTLDAIQRFGYETWFTLGDRDLATHLFRTQQLREGATLSEATQRIAEAFGLRFRLLPVSDDRIRTLVERITARSRSRSTS